MVDGMEPNADIARGSCGALCGNAQKRAMSATKPTPGPWVLAGRYIQGPEQDIGDGDGGRLNIATCAVDWSRNGNPEQQANAALIVRAVNCHADLVAALQKLVSYNEDIRDGKINYRPQDHIDVARAALAKALEP